MLQLMIIENQKLRRFILESNNWEEFKSKLVDSTNKEKGDAFELLVKVFFKVEPKYQFYDEVWHYSEIPEKVKNQFKGIDEDIGIDLLAKDGNEYHPIQAKYYPSQSSLPAGKIQSFLTLYNLNKKSTQAYICTDVYAASKKIKDYTDKSVSRILGDTWDKLDEEFFSLAHQYLNKKKPKIKPYTARNHQKKALREAGKYFIKDGNDRGKLIFPCGSGKSLTGYWLTGKLQAKTTVVAVPKSSPG